VTVSHGFIRLSSDYSGRSQAKPECQAASALFCLRLRQWNRNTEERILCEWRICAFADDAETLRFVAYGKRIGSERFRARARRLTAIFWSTLYIDGFKTSGIRFRRKSDKLLSGEETPSGRSAPQIDGQSC